MTKSLRTFITATLVIVAIIVTCSILVAAAYQLLDAAGFADSAWRSIGSPSLASVGLAMLTMLAFARIIAGIRARAIVLQHKHELQERRLSVYLRLMQALRHPSSAPTSSDLPDIRMTEHELILLGSGQVISAYLAFGRHAATDSENSRQSLADLLLAMRKDLYRKDAINSDELREVFVAPIINR